MNHKPYFDWMQLALDDDLRPDQQEQLDAHLADCEDCLQQWVALNDVTRLFTSAPQAAPRSGFTGRFKARLAQQRSRPRMVWGALALGLSSLGAAALVIPLGLNLVLSTVHVAQQPATTLALFNGFNAATVFMLALLEAAFILLRAALGLALTQPMLWLAAGGALAVVAAWALMMRRYISEVYFQ